MQPILRRRRDPGLMLAMELHDMRVAGPAPTPVAILAGGKADTSRGGNRRGSAARSDERTSRESHS